MSGESWREPDTGTAAAGNQDRPRDADPYAPPPHGNAAAQGDPAPQGSPPSQGYPAPQGNGTTPAYSSPPAYGTPPGYGSPPAYGTPPGYGSPPAYGTPPGYGTPGVPPQGYGPAYPPAPGQPYGYPPYGYAPAPIRTSGMAIASLVLGLVWIYWVGSILAVIFGHLALNETKRDPRVGGRGMAIAGLVLGYIGLAVLVIALIALAVSGPSPSSVD